MSMMGFAARPGTEVEIRTVSELVLEEV